ncbi:uncharacterized protein LOC133039378 [Cannabis sativa]|uniref:uncharacterized protein LOC133039378 n=1 Tax=Cannabis sativa TaxID=3483 RepID=UPI0029C9F074|nr:uncharacterized protein LOC133039378 [Cannabis sativa]
MELDENCKWRLRGKKKALCDMFEVTVFHNEHTCNLDSRHSDHRQAAPWVIGHIIKNKYTSDGSNYKAKDIQGDMFDEYGIKMSYEKAWRCREKAVMKGFKYCRPVISIDGTFLKTKYGGTTVSCRCVRCKQPIVSVAFAIVDGENHDSWKYFLRKLKEAIGPVENLMFISDRHQSIEHAVDVVFPEACHCACFKHITMNVNHKFKTDVCNKQIWLATRRNMIGILRFTLQNWFASRLEKASKCATPLATTFENDLKDQHKDGMFRSVLRNGAQLFNVGTSPQGERGGDVNLVERTCTCGLFQMLKIPCPHACAAISQNVSVYTLCSPYYTKETWKKTYDATINIVGEEDEWVLPEHIKNIRIGVPVEKKPVGRPRKSNAGRRPTKRRPSSGRGSGTSSLFAMSRFRAQQSYMQSSSLNHFSNF